MICGGKGSRLPYIWNKYKKPIFVMVCVWCQFLVSAGFWNYFMFHYHMTLETDQYGGDVNLSAILRTQNEILKSSAMWMISYFWRLVNPQTMTQVQLLAILYNKECDMVLNTQLLGFLPSIFVAFGSLTHLHYAQHLVKIAAYS